MIAVDDLDDHFIGVMGIAFNEQEHKLSKEEWIFIRQKVGAIGSLLTNYLKTIRFNNTNSVFDCLFFFIYTSHHLNF